MIVNQRGAAFSCGTYARGHDVHYIQARLSEESETDLPVKGHLLEVGPDGLVLVEVDGGVRRLWNHDQHSLAQLVALNNGEVSYQQRFSLLRVPKAGGSYLFCVVDADRPDRQPCPEKPPTGDPVQLLKAAAGFSIPGPEALRWIESQSD
ncbi:MAG: hypothetical protein M3454_17020 [Actinomycetota bacterium]|nr:hypothetical protein [Actinomycetota bacterium]